MEDLFSQIRATPVQRIDEMLADNLELQDLILRNAEFIRIKNLDYFEKKSKFNSEKREFEIVEAEKIRRLTEAENKNEQTRKAAVVLDPTCMAQKRLVQTLELELEQIEQELWTLRHVESNFRMIAELRIIELKRTV